MNRIIILILIGIISGYSLYNFINFLNMDSNIIKNSKHKTNNQNQIGKKENLINNINFNDDFFKEELKKKQENIQNFNNYTIIKNEKNIPVIEYKK